MTRDHARPSYSLPEKRDFAARMRQNPTAAEELLWTRLRRNQLGWKFNRQSVVCGYILDFWCHQTRLAVEVDGWIHETEDIAVWDDEKERALESYGIGLLRFTNDEVSGLLTMVVDNIRRECQFRGSRLFKGFDLPDTSITSSSSRACVSLEKKGQHSATNDDSPTPPRWKSSPPPTSDQRITEEELQNLTRRIAVLSRQRSMNFTDDRPSAEKAFEQRYKLLEKLRRRA